MVYKIADNILSPLGETTEANYQAVRTGRSALHRNEGRWQLPLPFTASLFTGEQEQAMAVEGLSRFESLAYTSARRAVSEAGLDVSGADVVFILSSTKGNIEQLGPDDSALLGDSALRIARRLGITTQPVVACNACISGLSALILAYRLLEAGKYACAVVCGADCQGRFIVSGFQSLMALSPDECRPFDMERTGLNLGEAAATMILSNRRIANSSGQDNWAITAGVIRNDAYHISAPAKDGEGARLALQAVAGDGSLEELAFINAHGTATMFNDQMESLAISRAGLSAVPVNGYKGYFGHTMGAAGVLETVLSMRALDDGTILGTRGFEELGVSGEIRLSADHQSTSKTAFVKMISGFGGCNAAIRVDYGDGSPDHLRSDANDQENRPRDQHHITISPSSATLDGRSLAVSSEDRDLLTDLYKRYIDDYPKYYKMDPLSRLGFVASELLLQAAGEDAGRAVVLFNRSSSVCADRKYLASIAAGSYFPSPSVFVYTLPNIVTGEIAIRHHLQGETSFYILPQRDERLMRQITTATLADSAVSSLLTGWIDYADDHHFEAELSIINKTE